MARLAMCRAYCGVMDADEVPQGESDEKPEPPERRIREHHPGRIEIGDNDFPSEDIIPPELRPGRW